MCPRCGSAFSPRYIHQKFCQAACYKGCRTGENLSQKIDSIVPVEFANEHEFEKWFEKTPHLFGIKRFIKIDPLFPDVRAVMMDGGILNIELEYHAKRFESHGHDPNGCDLIISYFRAPSITSIRGVPVLSVLTATGSHNNIDLTSVQISPEFERLGRATCNVIRQYVPDIRKDLLSRIV